MLKTKIKASSITNLTDARYFAAWGAEWLGFCLDANTAHYIAPQAVVAIKEWVEGPKIVGEFGLQTADEIRFAAEQLQLDIVQLNMLTDEALLKQLSDLTIFKEIVIEDADTVIDTIEFHLHQYSALVAVFVLDFEKNKIPYEALPVEAKTFLEDICKQHRILISIPIDPEKLPDLIDEWQPLGLYVAGGAEEKVGFKSFDELDEVFEALED